MALTPSIIGPTSRQYFADLTNSVLMQGRLEADDAWRQAYHSQMAKTWAYYGNNRGEMEGDIRKKANEHPADYANKPKSTIALVDRAVQQYVANVYGLPVLRTVPNYPEFEKQIIEINHGVPDRRNVYRKLQIATEIAGTSFVIPRIRSNGQLDFDIYTMDQMYPTLDPLTGELVGMALETVLDLADTSITRTEAWTNDGWIVYEDGKLLEQGDNPYGRIPGVVFRAEDAGMLWWGSSRAMKLVDANRDINEMRTDLRALTTDQAASLLVITGVDGELGDEVLAVVGANRYTTLPEGCDAKYIMPDVPTDKILQVLDSFIDQALRDGALITITKDGKSPESGFGMVVRKTPETAVMQHKREQYADADAELQEVALLTKAVAESGSPKRLAEDFRVLTEFDSEGLMPKTGDEIEKEAFARKLDIEMGITSPVDEIQARFKLTRSEAIARFEENKKLNAPVVDSGTDERAGSPDERT